MASNKIPVGVRPPNWISKKSFQEVTEWIVRAEEIGFDSVHVGEQLLSQIPPYESTLYGQKTSLATFAAHTDLVELGSLIHVMPYMHPVHVAKIFATLDIASEGRAILGIGAGYKQQEFDALDIPMQERGVRMKEGAEILRKLWTEENVDYDGKIYSFDGVTVEPKPVQEPHLPIWFGAFSPVEEFTPAVHRLLERVGRFGDGWAPMPYSNTENEMIDPDQLGRAWGIIEDAAIESGRDPDDIEIIFSHWSYVMMDESEEKEKCKSVLDQWFSGTYKEAKNAYPIGTPEEIVSVIETTTAELPRIDRFIFTPFTFNHRQQDLFADEVASLARKTFE